MRGRVGHHFFLNMSKHAKRDLITAIVLSALAFLAFLAKARGFCPARLTLEPLDDALCGDGADGACVVRHVQGGLCATELIYQLGHGCFG